MKKIDFSLKKKVVILFLITATVVLGTGLIYSISNGHNPKDTQVSERNNKVSGVEIDDWKIDNEDHIKLSVIDAFGAKDEVTQDDAVNADTETIKKETTPARPEPPKEKPRTEDDITNKSKVPTYSEEKVKPQSQPTPKGGDTNNKGQVYFPGFGWVDNSGENKGETVTSDGDISKQVGTMD